MIGTVKQSTKATANHTPYVRWMNHLDLLEYVIPMERASFSHPWTEAEFTRALRQRDCIGMVCEVGGKIVGYMIYELHKSHLHLLNFAVDAEHRRKGCGSAMIERLSFKMSYHLRSRITVEVRETNLQAQLFFKSQDFRCVVVVKDFYEEVDESMYLMLRQFNADFDCIGV